MGDLAVEGLCLGRLFADEGTRSCCRAEDVLGVRVLECAVATIAGAAIVFVEAVSAGIRPTEMSLAEVGSCVAACVQ